MNIKRITINVFVVGTIFMSMICAAHVVAGDFGRDAIEHAGEFAMSWAGLCAVTMAWVLQQGESLTFDTSGQPQISLFTGGLLIASGLPIGFLINTQWNAQMENLFLGVYGLFGPMILGAWLAFYFAGFRLVRRHCGGDQEDGEAIKASEK